MLKSLLPGLRVGMDRRASFALVAVMFFMVLPTALPAPSQQGSMPLQRRALQTRSGSKDPCTSSCNPYLGPAKPGADYASGSTDILEGAQRPTETT